MWTLEDALLVIGELTMEKRLLENEILNLRKQLEERAEQNGEVSHAPHGS